MVRSASALTGLSLLVVASSAQATITDTYTTSAAFLADVTVLPANTITFGVGSGIDITLNGAAAFAAAGGATISAGSGNLFGGGTVLSTETEQTAVVITFAQPVLGVGLYAYISDPDFVAVDGVLNVEAVGSGSTTVTTNDLAAAFFGFRSDISFTSLRISIDSFNQDITSAPFVGLTNTLLVGQAPRNEQPVPAPGLAALLLPAFLLGYLRRRRAAAAN